MTACVTIYKNYNIRFHLRSDIKELQLLTYTYSIYTHSEVLIHRSRNKSLNIYIGRGKKSARKLE